MVDNIPENAVCIKKMKEDEKIPQSMIERNVVEEKRYGITDFKCAVTKSYEYDRYTYLKITGECTAKTTEYILIIFMIYNANNELIGADFDEELNAKMKGKKSFSRTVQVPKDEYVTRIAVRFVPDPVFI